MSKFRFKQTQQQNHSRSVVKIIQDCGLLRLVGWLICRADVWLCYFPAGENRNINRFLGVIQIFQQKEGKTTYFELAQANATCNSFNTDLAPN